MAAHARIIDLEEYRRRRTQQVSPTMNAGMYGAGMFTAAVAWYPVMVWVPFWPMY